jgi:hypothetical protein
METDWPANEAEELLQHLKARLPNDPDMASTVLLAALSRPWKHVAAHGGPAAYAEGILDHKKADLLAAEKLDGKVRAGLLYQSGLSEASAELLPDARRLHAKKREKDAARRKLDSDGLPMTTFPLPTTLAASFDGPAPKGAHLLFPDSKEGRIRDPASERWLSPDEWPYLDRYVLSPSGTRWVNEAWFRSLRPPTRAPEPEVAVLIRRALVLSDKLRQAANDFAANLGPPSQREHLAAMVDAAWTAALGFDKQVTLVSMEFVDAVFAASKIAIWTPEFDRSHRHLGRCARDVFAARHADYALRLEVEALGQVVDAWIQPTRAGVPRWGPTRAMLVALHNPDGGDEVPVPTAASLEKMWKKHHALRHPQALGA